jgi:hypothetical protein
MTWTAGLRVAAIHAPQGSFDKMSIARLRIGALRAAARLAAYLGPAVVGLVPDVTRALSQFLLSAP